MVKIVDQRGERNLHFSEVRMGQAFWSPTYSCFMLKIEECGCDDFGGAINAVRLPEGTTHEVESTEIVEPCRAEIQIFNC